MTTPRPDTGRTDRPASAEQATEPAQAAAEAPEQQTLAEDSPETEAFPREYVERLRQEAAEHRTKAKRGDTLARRLVLSYAQALGKLADPTDLPFDEALCDDDGIPDPAKIADAIDELLARKPHLGDRRPRGDVGQGATAEATTVDLAGMLRSRAG